MSDWRDWARIGAKDVASFGKQTFRFEAAKGCYFVVADETDQDFVQVSHHDNLGRWPIYLRVRPGILSAGCEPYNSTQHEADHCKNDETDVATREVLVIFDNAPAAAKPAIRALNDPALG
jgi:hypothetical protein